MSQEDYMKMILEVWKQCLGIISKARKKWLYVFKDLLSNPVLLNIYDLS